MPLARTDGRWIRAMLFGVLAGISTIVTIVIVVTIHSVAIGGPMTDMTSRFAGIAGASIGILGGAFYVYLFARWIGSLVSRRFIEHGLVVAAVAVVVHIATSLSTPEALRPLQYAADVLKLFAAALGGWVSSRNV